MIIKTAGPDEAASEKHGSEGESDTHRRVSCS